MADASPGTTTPAHSSGRGHRIARRLYFSLARSPLRLACESRVVTRLITPCFTMTADDVLRVTTALADRGVQGWVGGGWGVDALIGHQTRQHSDLDLIIGNGKPLVDTAHLVLDGLGLRFLMERRTALVTPRRLRFADDDGRSIDLLSVDLDAPPFSGRVAGRPPFTTGVIGGELLACLSGPLQLALHTGYRYGPVDGSDITMLQNHLRMADAAGPDGP
jgi:lincosamide nucleotidyltransferase A/C/D/E